MKIEQSGQIDGLALKVLRTKAELQPLKDNAFQQALHKASQEKDDIKLRGACQEIEAVFVNQLLRQMRATVSENGLIDKSAGRSIYQEMLDEEYSKLIAKSHSSIGIAEMLYKQLKQDIIIRER